MCSCICVRLNVLGVILFSVNTFQLKVYHAVLLDEDVLRPDSQATTSQL